MRLSRLERWALPIVLLLLCLGLHWTSGTFESEFGRYPDEGMHYVTGLMIGDWLGSGKWAEPMRFAREFYVHFPKVALGNWPPVFPAMQALWGIVVSDSRSSMLVMMMILAALLASEVYRQGAAFYGRLWAIVPAMILLATSLTQAQTAMVMAEIPLALFSFVAMWRFSRWLETGSWSDAVWFAGWTVVAVFTKGNAWVIALAAPLTILFFRRFDLLRNLQSWAVALLIALPTVPYTLFTMSIVQNGWNTRSAPGLEYTMRSLLVHGWFTAEIFSVVLTSIALLGVYDRVLRPGRKASPYWVAMASYWLCIIIFHSMVPTSIEPRKIYQVTPVIAVFLGAGLDWVSRQIARRLTVPAWQVRAGVALATAVFFLAGPFSLLRPHKPGFGPAVEQLLSRQDRRNAAVLISSSPFLDDSEAALIGEWAERERTAGTYLVRGTKLLSRPTSTGPDAIDYAPLFPTVEQMQEAVNSVPVSYIVLHNNPAPRYYRHHDLLKQMLAAYAQEWELIYQGQRGPDALHEIEIYRNRRNLQGIAVKLSIDLEDKIGRHVGTEQ